MSGHRKPSTAKTVIRRLRYGDPIPDGEPRRFPHPNGYVRLRWRVGPHELVECFEHRFVMGMPPDHLHVHHVNHDRSDNRAENLRVVTATEHRREHAATPVDEIKRLYDEGLSIPEVGRRVGIAHSGVYRLLVKEGVEIRPGSDYHRRTDISDDDIRGLYTAGVSARRIASVLGCSPSFVNQRIKEMDLATRRCGRQSGAQQVDAERAIERFLSGRAA